MKRAALAVLLAPLALVGCSGSGPLGFNSPVTVHLMRTDGTQDMTQFEVYLTRNGSISLNTLNPGAYVSTVNRPSWCDVYSSSRSATELTLNFTTRSDQPPYYMFVKVPNTGAAFETLALKIDMNTVAGPTYTYNVPINATTRLTAVNIGRNSATY